MTSRPSTSLTPLSAGGTRTVTSWKPSGSDRRCGTVEIRQTSEWNGTLYKPTKYRYPKGYKLPSAAGMPGDRVSSAAARLEGVHRFLKRNPIRIKRRA
jgi:hypothetical protein